jgi:nitrogen fixation protein NifU and related proteins
MPLSDPKAELSALYQEMILDHYRKPRNKGTMENADRTVAMRNPLCGDEVDLQVKFSPGAIEDLKFTGRGCSISQASASMMTQIVKGKSPEEAEQLRKKFRDMIMGDSSLASDTSLGSLRSLVGVSRFPARVRCALLAWNALEEAMAAPSSPGSENNGE